MYDLVYIHPSCTFMGRDAIIPMGLLTMVSNIPVSKTGYFESEVRDGDLKESDIFLMDIHWAFSLNPAVRLAERIRESNPQAKIICGGYTASVFAEQLVRETEIDYVVRGDADDILPRLVTGLLGGEDVSGLPNVTGEGFSNPIGYVMTPDGFASCRFSEPTWFPTFIRYMKRYQKNFYPTYTYPFIPVSRGCYYRCETCYGNPVYQRRLCGRGAVFRNGESIIEDLQTLESMDWIRFVYIIGDLDSPHNAKNSDVVLSRKYDLDLYYEYYNNPKIEHLDAMMKSFNYLFLCLFTVKNHLETDDVADLDELEAAVARAHGKNVNCNLFVNPDLEDKNPGYARRVHEIYKRYGCDLFNMKSYVLSLEQDIPFPSEDPDAIERQYKVFVRKTANDPLALWFRRNVLHKVFFNQPLTALARKVHTRMTDMELLRKCRG